MWVIRVFSKCDCWTSNISISWELGRNANSQVPPYQTYQILWVLAEVMNSTNTLEDFNTYSILRTSTLNWFSVQFSRPIVSNFLWPCESQHARPPCPSPTPGVHSNSCPSSWWCHPAISSSAVPFPSCPQVLQASGSFSMNQLFAWGGPSIGVSASTSVLPMNTQDWSPLGWTGWISLQSKGLSRVFSNTTVFT